MKLKYFFVGLLLLCFIDLGAATDEDVKPEIGVVLLSKHENNKVLLRWAPASPVAWELSNKSGWWIERIMIPSGDFPGDTVYTLLTKEPIKPLPLADWEIPSDTCNYSAIAAQVLYGKTLDITSPDNAMVFIQKAREMDARYSFGLTAAEQNFKIAQMMGLGFTDIVPDVQRTYIYIVYAALSEEIAKVDTAGVVVKVSEDFQLPNIFDVSVELRDTSAIIKWPAGYFKGYYSGYDIEKSTNNGEFSRVNNLPVVNIFKDGQDDFFHFYADYQNQDGDVVSYRVLGRTPFGDRSQPSEAVEVVVPMYFPQPEELKYSELNDDIAIVWEFPQEYNHKIKEFIIEGATNFKDIPIKLNNAKPNDRGALIKLTAPEMFVSVVAVGIDETKRPSYPIMIQLEDSIPPAPPINLKGSIDSLGITTVMWDKGKEPDLFGYRIYAGVNPDAEFSLITSDFVRDTVYSWPQSLNTLSSSLFVAVMAYDYRYNYSGYSEILELFIPDTIPPTPPIFSKCEFLNGKVFFEWIPSGSSDIYSHSIFYKITNSENEEKLLLEDLTNKIPFYVWTNPLPEKLEFYVKANDKSGNEAISIQTYVLDLANLAFSDFKPRLVINKDIENGHVKLQWDKPKKSESVVIYRSINGEPLRAIYTAKEDSYFDSSVLIGYKYSYVIQHRDSHGRTSQFSEEIEIIY